ncbi:hypothetical protein NP590_20440 [Methylomonas sp. SURF-2]|uniref:DUF4124 domain-containing protein n=1 Tax=Methylomonas subterranea TaxID=2952225 RepID=A0ABT1TM13_9GAMM|nr:hypothetical protein [Methylomonas sp. SURF-2]MCQ8106478.1 hypothetical protein [Methylomonas sp. SURF-2]
MIIKTLYLSILLFWGFINAGYADLYKCHDNQDRVYYDDDFDQLKSRCGNVPKKVFTTPKKELPISSLESKVKIRDQAITKPFNTQGSLDGQVSSFDIDKLTSYAVMLGRALGCGIDTKYASSKIGEWIDRVFPPGSNSQITYLPIFLSGIQHHAKQQVSGNSPDNCSAVTSAFNKMPLP